MENESPLGPEYSIESVEAALEAESSMDAFFEEGRQESIRASLTVLKLLRQHNLVSKDLETFLAHQTEQLSLAELYVETMSLVDENDPETHEIEDPMALLREIGVAASVISAYNFYAVGGPDEIRSQLEADLLNAYELTPEEFAKLTPVIDILFDGKPGLSFDNTESFALFEKVKAEDEKRMAFIMLKQEITPIMALLFNECREEGLVPKAHDDLDELFLSMASALHHEQAYGTTEEELLVRLRWENIHTLATRMGVDVSTINTVRDRLRVAYDVY